MVRVIDNQCTKLDILSVMHQFRSNLLSNFCVAEEVKISLRMGDFWNEAGRRSQAIHGSNFHFHFRDRTRPLQNL